jgi:hypothetical protein
MKIEEKIEKYLLNEGNVVFWYNNKEMEFKAKNIKDIIRKLKADDIFDSDSAYKVALSEKEVNKLLKDNITVFVSYDPFTKEISNSKELIFYKTLSELQNAMSHSEADI